MNHQGTDARFSLVRTMMTVKQISERLNVSLALVYKLVGNGDLESYRIGNAIRVSEQQLRDYLDRTLNGANPIGAGGFKHLKI